MYKNRYYLAISLLGLLFLQDIFLLVVQFETGNRIYLLHAYLPFFILSETVRIAGMLALQWYYRSRGYRQAFQAGWLYISAMVVFGCIMVCTLTGIELQNWYYALAGIVWGSSIWQGLSLWLSKSRERRWLRYSGIALSVIGSLQLVILLLFLMFTDYKGKLILEHINFWLGGIWIFVPCLYILNWAVELKETPDEVGAKSPGPLAAGIFPGITIIVLALTVFYGWNLHAERSVRPLPQVISQRAEAIASRFERHSFVNSGGDSLHYRLFKPVGYDPGRKYPLILCLHHGGVHGNDNVVHVEGSYAPFLSDYNNRINYPAILLVPQCPRQMSWGSREVELSIIELIASLEKELSIDSRRRYVMGESGGGYGSWYFIGNHPELFAAAIPVCGAGDERLAGNMAKRAIWAFHGSQDPLISVDKSREMVQAIRKAGGNPRYTEFAGAGHSVSRQVWATPGLLYWLFAQKRPE